MPVFPPADSSPGERDSELTSSPTGVPQVTRFVVSNLLDNTESPSGVVNAALEVDKILKVRRNSKLGLEKGKLKIKAWLLLFRATVKVLSLGSVTET